MRIVMRYLIGALLVVLSLPAKGQQQEANIWYFGRFLGLDFNNGAPVPLNDGMLNTTEGVATISDANGNLLFYSEGTKVWNRFHQVMPNGTGLNGSFSSSQSGVIVPFVNDPTRYYLFTVDLQSGPKGLAYSVINMTLDGGKGDVETKNVTIQLNVVEKITAIRHCNNRDVWVLAHGSASDAYYAFLVTQAGVNPTPVVSNTGSILTGIIPPSITDSTSLGCMKVSLDGKKIAAAHWTANVDVSDFNNATGVVSNSYSLIPPTDPRLLSYGVEFSPDNRLLYVTGTYIDPNIFVNRNALFQYDVSLATPAAVRASKQIISQIDYSAQIYASLQNGPDGKMYLAKNIFKHIAAINNPNVYGSGCNFVSNAVQWTLPQQECSFGLPNFIQSYFVLPDSFTYVVNCPGLSVNFNYTIPPSVNSIKWDFGDPASGANNTSTIPNPVHIYTAPGVYNVELIKFTNCGTDTLRKQVATSGIFVNLGNDTLVCGGTNVLLNSNATGVISSYLWQDGSTNSTLLATTPGQYWVQVSSNTGCSVRDTINVNFKPKPVYSLGNDTTICVNDTLTLNATVTGATSYLWNTGATTPTIKAFTAGIYWCDVNKEGCYFRDSLALNVAPRPIVNLGTDISTCGLPPILLNATNPNCTYLWQDGSTNATFNVTASGQFWVQVKNLAGCTTRDTIVIAFNTVPVFNLGADRSICQDDTLTLNATVPTAVSYLWNTGATTPTIKAFQAGTYWCEVNNGCVFRDTIVITAVLPKPVVNLGSDQAICGNTPVTLDATNPNCTYLWQNGSTNPTITANTTGLYWVQVTSNGGCFKRDSVNIAFNSIPVFNLGADVSICQEDTLTLNASVPTAVSYLWNTGANTPTIKAFQAGTYWCEVNNGCVFRDTIVITAVVPKPVVNLGADVTVCGNDPVLLNASSAGATYLWQDGSTNSTLSAVATGLYWVEVTNSGGCSKRDSIYVTFNPYPVFNLGPDTDICQGDVKTLNASVANATSYQWSTGANTATILVFQAGIYWCEVIKQGCSFRDSLIINNVKPLPQVNLGPDQTVCEDVVVSLNAAYPNATYTWQDGSTGPVFNVTTPGVYSVQLDLNGCKNSDTVRINHNLKPRFTLGPDQVVCPGSPIILSPALNTNWQLLWENGSTAPTHTVTEPGQYSLTATNNCGDTFDEIIVSKGVCKVFMPSGFTPNNDGLNDVFRALGTETVTKFEMKIFNRWGEVVFQSIDKSRGWDGKVAGVMQASAVFIYTVRYIDINSPLPQTLKGTLTLIR
jgi:gliding motility-associated-like protein